ncbi:TonB-dependent siderophore receptor [Providencia sneebia]|uniref:TonB-dependent ferric siderephore receptor n=1 Tax=Providencia sneebia DSM 19967 TaxID=1141660 RepID=K8W617_9GAMM|nr:TonB-dependent siderophore receptor [Providencia sneebia]EKT55979.1 TonB-dependent ferric siderephore receptor [Providencia sneebia DSM 19967]
MLIKSKLSLLSMLIASPLALAGSKSEVLIVTPPSSNEIYTATKTTSATKTDTEIAKLPQTVNVVTKTQMENRAAETVVDALRYTPGVVTEYRGDSNRNDEVFSRGFDYANKILDGISFGGNASSSMGTTEPWFLDRVEMIKGPASVQYGQISPGGVIVMTSKKPTAEKINKVQLRAGNRNKTEGFLDLGGKLTDDGTVLYRLNGLAKKKDTQVKDYEEEKYAIAPAITFLNENTTFTLLGYLQNSPKNGYRNFLPKIGTLESTPEGKIPQDFNISNPDYNISKQKQHSIGYEFEHNFSDTVSLVQKARYAEIDEKYNYLVFNSISTEAANYPYILKRMAQHEKTKLNTFGVDTHLNFDINHNRLSQTLLVGVDYKWTKEDKQFWRDRNSNYDIDWRNPNYQKVDESKQTVSTDQLQKSDQVGVYLQDQLEWNNWNLLASTRYDWVEVRTQDRTSSNRYQQNDGKLTGLIGLLYTFDNGISPYISYSTSFEPNLATNRKPGSKPFDPKTAKQTEVGIKYLTPDQNTLATLSFYDIEQKNIPKYDSDLGYMTLIGKGESKGIEAQINSKITDKIAVTGAYAYTKTKVLETTNPAEKGKEFPRIPKNMFSAWGQYNENAGMFNGAKAGVGIRYIGSSKAAADNSFSVPSVTLYDAMVGYDLGELSSSLKGATIQLNVNNLTDKHYVSSCGMADACFYGIGRTGTVTFDYSW